MELQVSLRMSFPCFKRNSLDLVQNGCYASSTYNKNTVGFTIINRSSHAPITGQLQLIDVASAWRITASGQDKQEIVVKENLESISWKNRDEKPLTTIQQITGIEHAMWIIAPAQI